MYQRGIMPPCEWPTTSTFVAGALAAHPQIVRTMTNHTSMSRPTIPIPTQPSTIPAMAIPRPRFAPPEFGVAVCAGGLRE